MVSPSFQACGAGGIWGGVIVIAAIHRESLIDAEMLQTHVWR